MLSQTLIQLISALALTSTLVGAAPSESIPTRDNQQQPPPLDPMEVGRVRQAFRGMGNVTVEWTKLEDGNKKAHIDRIQIASRSLARRSINVDPATFLKKNWGHGQKKTIADYGGWEYCIEGGSQVVPQFIKDGLPSICEHFLNEIPGKQTINAGWDLFQQSGIRVNPSKKNDKSGGEPGFLNWALGRVDVSASTFDQKLCKGLTDAIIAPQCLWDGDTAGVIASAAGWALMADPEKQGGDNS